MSLNFVVILAISIGYAVLYFINRYSFKKISSIILGFFPLIQLLIIWILFWSATNFLNLLELFIGSLLGFLFIVFVKFIRVYFKQK
jgi:hypothetical protein